MYNYFEPDPRWRFLGANDRESYLEQFVVVNSFHEMVPDELQEDFLTAEHFMAHAYYHQPMYETALSHMFFLRDKAVRIKARQLDIPDATLEKMFKIKRVSLANLIKQITDRPYLKFIRNRLARSRKFQSNELDAEKENFSNEVDYQIANIQQIANTINHLFRPDEDLLEEYEAQKIIEKQLNFFDKKLLVAIVGGQRFLCHKILQWRILDNALLLSLAPVVNKSDNETGKPTYMQPISIIVPYFNIEGAVIHAQFPDQKILMLETTTKTPNQRMYADFYQDFQGLSTELKHKHNNYYKEMAGWDIEQMTNSYFLMYKMALENNL